MSTDIKLNSAQISKIIQLDGSFWILVSSFCGEKKH